MEAIYQAKRSKLDSLMTGRKCIFYEISLKILFRNDGTWDRIETFNLFATDPDATSWEEYNLPQAQRFQDITGDDYKTFTKGLVQLELWQAIGGGNLRFQSNNPSSSLISLPYNNTYQSSPSSCSCKLISSVPN